MNPSWMQIALDEQGQAELTGNRHNARILEYHSVTTLKAKEDEVPWCSSFVSWCLTKAGLVSTASARAKSYESWGVPIKKPVYGAIVTFTRNGGGHVGFYTGQRDGKWLILGGNQSNRVSIASYDPSKVTSIRWPTSVPLPNAVAPLSKSGVIQGSVLTGLATAGSIGAGLIENAPSVDQAQRWIGQGGYVALVLGILALVGVIWTIVSRVNGKKQAEAEVPS